MDCVGIAMKLQKSEIRAIIICGLFLVLGLGFMLGRSSSEAEFSVSGGLTTVEKREPEPPETSAEPAAEKEAEPLLLNINLASSDELQALDGIGPELAGRIVAYRKANGYFRSIEEICKVQGIGASKFEAIRHSITVG